MKVRFVGHGRDSTGDRARSGFLSDGAEYTVIGVAIDKGRVQFLVMSDKEGHPVYEKAEAFDLVSAFVPSIWEIKVGQSGSTASFAIEPRGWLDDNVLAALWDDDPLKSGPARARLEEDVATLEHEEQAAT